MGVGSDHWPGEYRWNSGAVILQNRNELSNKIKEDVLGGLD